jgi:hypothetical protein
MDHSADRVDELGQRLPLALLLFTAAVEHRLGDSVEAFGGRKVAALAG